MPRLKLFVSRQIVVLASLLGVIPAMAAQPPGDRVARAETVRAAEAGDDERFGVSLAADGVRVVMFLNEPFSWGSPPPDSYRASASSVDDVLVKYRTHHPYLAFGKLGTGVLVATMPRSHCAVPVLNQQIENWSFSGPYRDFEPAFDRRLHHLENVVEGGSLGPPPAPDSPMLTPVTVSVRMATGLATLMQALEQVEGAVVIFREFRDRSGESHCVRETYTRDHTSTTFIGYDRNPERFPRPVR